MAYESCFQRICKTIIGILHEIFPKKWKFMVRQGNILGRIVSQNGISKDIDKISIIVNLLRLINLHGV